MLKIIVSVLILSGFILGLFKILPALTVKDFLLGLKVIASVVAATTFIFVFVQLF